MPIEPFVLPGRLAGWRSNSEIEVARLITSGKAVPLKYFEKGRVKKGYAMFLDPEAAKKSRWKYYFLKAVAEASLTKS